MDGSFVVEGINRQHNSREKLAEYLRCLGGDLDGPNWMDVTFDGVFVWNAVGSLYVIHYDSCLRLLMEHASMKYTVDRS